MKINIEESEGNASFLSVSFYSVLFGFFASVESATMR